MIGPGIYDAMCQADREEAAAETVLLIVIDGNKGTGFSMQTKNLARLASVPRILRGVADQIEADHERGKL